MVISSTHMVIQATNMVVYWGYLVGSHGDGLGRFFEDRGLSLSDG